MRVAGACVAPCRAIVASKSLAYQWPLDKRLERLREAGIGEDERMDKPRHPLVVRPWNIRRTKQHKWNVPPVKTEVECVPFHSKSGKSGSTRAKKHGKVPRLRT